MIDDRGHAAVEFGLAAGLLLFPVALAVLSFGPWSEARVASEAMAAEAARAAVISLDLDSGESVVDQMAANLGFEGSEVRLGWCGEAPARGGVGSCVLARGAEVVAEVNVYTPLFTTPWGGIGGLWVDATHSEPIDLYRSIP